MTGPDSPVGTRVPGTLLPVGRLAPSPTGLLHLGHARSFLVAWWHARSRGGSILLRMEDLDAGRVRPGATDEILRDLEWLGLDWDGPVVLQSSRQDSHRAAIAALERTGQVYPCICTRKEIELAASAPHEADRTIRYPGTCRTRFRSFEHARSSTGRTPALRFHVAAPPVDFHDELFGPQSFDVAHEVGDFPITTRDAIPAYQLAVVLDDAAQAITEIVRGADLLPSTARQILLQRALSLPHPRWWHLPLVLDSTGHRLAKRSDPLSLSTLRARGLDPRQITTWAARTCRLPTPSLLTPADYLPTFAIHRIPLTPVQLPPDPLTLFPPP